VDNKGLREGEGEEEEEEEEKEERVEPVLHQSPYDEHTRSSARVLASTNSTSQDDAPVCAVSPVTAATMARKRGLSMRYTPRTFASPATSRRNCRDVASTPYLSTIPEARKVSDTPGEEWNARQIIAR